MLQNNAWVGSNTKSHKTKVTFDSDIFTHTHILISFVCTLSSSSEQITEALTFLHYSGHIIHRNVCPSSILVTKKGTWKLAGLEFTGEFVEIYFTFMFASKIETVRDWNPSYAKSSQHFCLRYKFHWSRGRWLVYLFFFPHSFHFFTKTFVKQFFNQFAIFIIPLSLPFFLSLSIFFHLFSLQTFIERVNETDPVEPVPCQPWSSRASKMTQPNLDYMGMLLCYTIMFDILFFPFRSLYYWLTFANIIGHYFVSTDEWAICGALTYIWNKKTGLLLICVVQKRMAIWFCVSLD